MWWKRISIWEWIFLFISFSILFYYFYLQKNSPRIDKYLLTQRDLGENVEVVSLEQVLRLSQNGDLVFLTGETKGEKTCRWFTDCIFSHVGVLFREIHPVTGEDTVYILDSDLGQRTKEGVRIQPLREKLHRYSGLRIGCWMKLLVWNNHLRPPTQNIVKVGADLLSLEFDNKIASWWAADRPWLYHFLKDENQVFCSELVAMVLQRLAVLQKSKVPAWYSPGNFFDRRELQLEEGYSYGVRHFFQFPLDETLDIMTRSQPVSTGLGNIHIPQLQEEV